MELSTQINRVAFGRNLLLALPPLALVLPEGR